ncbi:MAG: hypothetical protein WCS72_12700 [Deltaproteobacteria bacterium]
MSALSGDAVTHAVTFAELAVGGLSFTVAILVAGWKTYAALRSGWREDLEAALSRWADAHETRHQKHEFDLSEIRSQVASGLRRVHERIDVLSDRVPPT